MTDRGKSFVWLEDQKRSVHRLISYLQEEEGFSISMFKDGTEALDEIASRPPDLFFVDLGLDHGGEDGLSVAKAARVMSPVIPIVAVTQYLRRFSYDILLALVDGQYPFDVIVPKDRLDTPEDCKRFVKETIYPLLHRAEERHIGEVTNIESDYAQVTLRTPRGDQYERLFETTFLEGCGVGKAGEEIELVFWKRADGISGEVHMRVTKLAAEEETVDEKLKEILSKVDLKKIREKFGSAVDSH